MKITCVYLSNSRCFLIIWVIIKGLSWKRSVLSEAICSFKIKCFEIVCDSCKRSIDSINQTCSPNVLYPKLISCTHLLSVSLTKGLNLFYKRYKFCYFNYIFTLDNILNFTYIINLNYVCCIETLKFCLLLSLSYELLNWEAYEFRFVRLNLYACYMLILLQIWLSRCEA